MLLKKLYVLTLFLAFFSPVFGQTDTVFWFSAPNISQGLGDRPIYLYFNTYGQGSTVTVSQPANPSFPAKSEPNPPARPQLFAPSVQLAFGGSPVSG